MTDEQQVTIRNVRLCQCGKPAGHDSVCQPGQLAVAARVDRAWEEQNSERRSERYAKRQPVFRAERQRERDSLSTRELHDKASARAATLSFVKAANPEWSAAGSGHPSKNLALDHSGAQMLEGDPRWDGTWRAVRAALERAHELLDEYEGLGVAAADPDITPEAKDGAIVSPENEHLSASEFARQFPGYGAPTTISRKRRWFTGGFCTMNGLPPRSGCHCPTCHGAIL